MALTAGRGLYTCPTVLPNTCPTALPMSLAVCVLSDADRLATRSLNIRPLTGGTHRIVGAKMRAHSAANRCHTTARAQDRVQIKERAKSREITALKTLLRS